MNVLVTQVHNIVSVEILKLLRGCGVSGLKIFGTSIKPELPDGIRRLTDVLLRVEHAASSAPDEYSREIAEICRANNIDLVISGFDAELSCLQRLRRETDSLFITPDADTIERLYDKLTAARAMSAFSVPVPEIFTRYTARGKVICRKRHSVSSRGIIIADLDRGDTLPEVDESEWFLQRFIDGTEYTVNIFADRDGEPRLIIPRKRLKMENGISGETLVVYDEAIIGACRKICEAYRIPGLSNVQLIVSGDEIFFMEINLRFSATGCVGIRSSFNYFKDYLEHFVQGKPLDTYESYMSRVHWGGRYKFTPFSFDTNL